MWVESDTNVTGGEALVRQLVFGKRFFLVRTGRGDRGSVAAGLLRLFGRPASAHPALRVPLVPHPETFLERHQQVPSSHLLVGGHRRQPGLHPFPPGRHLQRRARTVRTGPRRRQLCRTGLRDALAGALRLRRRRRRPDPGDDGKGPPPGRPRRVAPGRGGGAVEVFRRRSGRVPRRAGVVGRALPRTAPGHASPARSRSNRATVAARTWCGRRSCGRPPPWWPGAGAYPYEELEEIWRDILLNQFHDILPGSSIAMVNDEAVASFANSARAPGGRHRPGHLRPVRPGRRARGLQRRPPRPAGGPGPVGGRRGPGRGPGPGRRRDGCRREASASTTA